MGEIPKDPVMLLSYVNLKLRDFYPDLEELCRSLDIEREELEKTMDSIGYEYDPKSKLHEPTAFTMSHQLCQMRECGLVPGNSSYVGGIRGGGRYALDGTDVASDVSDLRFGRVFGADLPEAGSVAGGRGRPAVAGPVLAPWDQ